MGSSRIIQAGFWGVFHSQNNGADSVIFQVASENKIRTIDESSDKEDINWLYGVLCFSKWR